MRGEKKINFPFHYFKILFLSFHLIRNKPFENKPVFYFFFYSLFWEKWSFMRLHQHHFKQTKFFFFLFFLINVLVIRLLRLLSVTLGMVTLNIFFFPVTTIDCILILLYNVSLLNSLWSRPLLNSTPFGGAVAPQTLRLSTKKREELFLWLTCTQQPSDGFRKEPRFC